MSDSGTNKGDIEARFTATIGTGSDPFTLDVDLRLKASGTTAIFGPSGAGKTTLLRCIAGLQPCRDGTLRIAGQTWQDSNSCIPAHQRAVGYVFQQPSLFAHLTALGNLEFARKRATPGGVALDFDEIVAMLGIGAVMAQPAGSLSGGEQQRVAIARALLSGPQLLLLDEPLASLDSARKAEILPFLENVAHNAGVPMLYVSHSVEEVMRLADEVVVLERGRVKRRGTVADTLGVHGEHADGEPDASIIETQQTAFDSEWQLAEMSFAGGRLWLTAEDASIGEHRLVRVMARDISITRTAATDTSILNILQAEIVAIPHDPVAATVLIELAIGPTRLLAELTRRSVATLELEVGQTVWAQIKSAAIVN